jgi:hypothetical protein
LAATLVVHLSGLDASQNQAIAAWVQAIGSILAIVGAVSVAGYQVSSSRREADARKEADEQEALRSMAMFVNQIEHIADRGMKAARRRQANGSTQTFEEGTWYFTIKRLTDGLAAVPFHQQPYSRVAIYATVLISAAEDLIWQLAQLKKVPVSGVAAAMDAMQENFESLQYAAARLRKAAGFPKEGDLETIKVHEPAQPRP